MKATVRLALTTAVAVVAIAVGLDAATSRNPSQPILSEHSQPAVNIPAEQVAVVAGGKTFHDPKCTALHGKPRMVSASEAVQNGYVPCVRCMRKALARQ
ncbi:MAG: hypothetical protein JWO13_2557 [Acidobacteriales bacterium]|nr:hypothetical protein [Terriglobales bacterium]